MSEWYLVGLALVAVLASAHTTIDRWLFNLPRPLPRRAAWVLTGLGACSILVCVYACLLDRPPVPFEHAALSLPRTGGRVLSPAGHLALAAVRIRPEPVSAVFVLLTPSRAGPPPHDVICPRRRCHPISCPVRRCRARSGQGFRPDGLRGMSQAGGGGVETYHAFQHAE